MAKEREPVREGLIEPVWTVLIDGVDGVGVFRSLEGARQSVSQHVANNHTQWVNALQLIVYDEDGKPVAIITRQQVFP